MRDAARTLRRRHPNGTRIDPPGLHELAPVRPRRALGAARRAGDRQGRDRQPDPLVQGTRHVGRDRGTRPRRCAEPRPAGRLRIGRQLRSGRGVRGRPGRRAVGRVRLARTPTAARSSACGHSARTSARSARTSTRPSRRRGTTRLRAGALLLVDGDDARISTGAATMALELTDAAGIWRAPLPSGRLRAGRQRRADQRHRVVDAPRGAGVPRRRRPGRGRPGDVAELARRTGRSTRTP